MASAIEAFIDYAIDVYGSWAVAKKGVSEIETHLAADDGDSYKLQDNVSARVFGHRFGSGYETLAAVINKAAPSTIRNTKPNVGTIFF